MVGCMRLCGFVTRSIGIDSLWKRNNGWGRSGENLVLLLLLLIPTVGHQAKSLLQRRQTKFNLSGASTIRFDFDEELHAARNSSKTERSVERSVHDKLRPKAIPYRSYTNVKHILDFVAS